MAFDLDGRGAGIGLGTLQFIEDSDGSLPEDEDPLDEVTSDSESLSLSKDVSDVADAEVSTSFVTTSFASSMLSFRY